MGWIADQVSNEFISWPACQLIDARHAWALLAPSRLPPIRGYTPSAPRYRLPCLGCLKHMTNAVFQQFDGPLQGAELSNPHHRDGHVQVEMMGDATLQPCREIVPGNKARWQQADSISGLNERQLQMHVVDFGRNHGR